MNRKKISAMTFILGPLAIAALLGVTAAVLAQTSGPYDLSWHTIDGGGATASAGGPYALGATTGQPDAGLMAGGPYTLHGGFWPGIVPTVDLYLPLVTRGTARP